VIFNAVYIIQFYSMLSQMCVLVSVCVFVHTRVCAFMCVLGGVNVNQSYSQRNYVTRKMTNHTLVSRD